MAAPGPFALRHLPSLLPLPHTTTRSPPSPLCPNPAPPLTPLSFRPRSSLRSTASRPTPISLLLPIHAEAPEEDEGGALKRLGPSLPAEVLFACHPAAALANVLHARSGYYNTQVVVADDEPEDRLVERFRRASVRAGVFRECRRRRFFEDRQAELKRRARDATLRRARDAARLRRIAGVAQVAGGASPPFPQRGKKKKKKRKPPQPSETHADDEDEDNWDLPEGEIPYC
uniref:30S ribosomal protein S21 n=1 Tax=Anthurium amnicola TaxID=1678845 RepID=A0A1D1YW56_9ARAE